MNQAAGRRALAALLLLASLAACGGSYESLARSNWDRAGEWKTESDGRSTVSIRPAEGVVGEGLCLQYALAANGGWVQVIRNVDSAFDEKTPLTFLVRAQGTGDLEMKFVDVEGRNFVRKVPLSQYGKWTQVVLYLESTAYGWGGPDDTFRGLKQVVIAVSGKGQGTVILDEVGFGAPGLAATYPPAGTQLDPDRDLAGVGFRQRRDAVLIPEDSGVLAWLALMQDRGSPDRRLLPSMEDATYQTFNNALVAMAFILKGERARAERILDFYAASTLRGNKNSRLQNFFLRGEPRGFYQHVNIRNAGGRSLYEAPNDVDRWMGDMAWLLIACKHHERAYGGSRYRGLANLLKGLLDDYFVKDAASGGGYVRHGWRRGDSKLHEEGGHPEGNLDCYAAYRLCGDDGKARLIRAWLDSNLKGSSLPLDLYTWRVLAYGREAAGLLNIPEYDLRYRKSVRIGDREARGFFDHPDAGIRNVWLDGTGHVACAFLTCGDRERGQFYANQLDAFLIDREIDGLRTRTLPYTANRTGGYDWVRTDRGFISAAAWYIFAKNRFNPLTLEHGSAG